MKLKYLLIPSVIALFASCVLSWMHRTELIEKRNQARSDKDWEGADVIREKLDNLGIILEDTPGGTIWKKK